ncbi:MAG: hypothetical protein HQK83_15550 [Fibrobacteria bacterium]|nr:hypothetical protein [Fibrobacteria bacterium]
MSAFIILLSLLLFGGVRAADTAPKKSPLLAVIEIVNNTGQHKAFVAGMPDMLITELMESENVNMVERTKIHTAMTALQLEASGLTEENNLQLGKWLGADQIVVGAFNKLDRKFRLDIRVIDVKTGTIVFASSATRGFEQLLEIIPSVGKQLRIKLDAKFEPKAVPTKVEIVKKIKNRKKRNCRMRIEYKMILGLFAEVSVPFQKVKVYLDGELVGVSPVINQLNRYFTLFNEPLDPGLYEITLVHGVVNRDGSWRENLESQPEKYLLKLREGDQVKLRYKMRAEDRWNSFSMLEKKK